MNIFQEFPSPTSIVLFLSILLLPLAHAFWLYKRGRWYAFDPLNAFWAGVAVVYILQPLEYTGAFLSLHVTAGLLERTLFWILFALLFVIVGYESPLGPRWALKIPRMPARLAPPRLTTAGVVLVFCGLLGYAYLIRSAHGLANWLSEGRGATNWEAVSGYVAQLEYILPVGVALVLFRVNLQPAGFLFKTFTWTLGGLMWLWFVYLGTRSRTIAWTGMLLVAYYLPRRKSPPVWLLGTVLVGLVLITNFQEYFRNYFTGLSFNLSQMSFAEVKARVLPRWFQKDVAERAVVSVSREFNCCMTVMELVPEKIPYNYGYGFLEFFTRPIPRAIWPSKRYPAMESVYDVLDQGGLSAAWIATSEKPLLMGPVFTYVGHWWCVGGPIALVVAGLLTGSLYRMIRSIFDRCGRSQGDLILYSQMFLIGFFDAAGWPFSWLFNLPLTLLPLLAMLYWSAQRSGGRGRPGKEARRRRRARDGERFERAGTSAGDNPTSVGGRDNTGTQEPSD